MKKRLALEITLLGICILTVVLCIIQDCYGFFDNFINLFRIRIADTDSMFMTLFSVQATVASLSIAIIAFITAAGEKNYYCISVSEFILKRRPVILKHKALLITDLVITTINYFAVSKCLFNLSISLFIISISISIFLLVDIFALFYDSEKIKKKMEDYILQNYSKDYVNNIEVNIISAIKNNQSDKVEELLHILLLMLQAELEKGHEGTLTVLIQKKLANAFTRAVGTHNNSISILVLEVIISAYEFANKEADDTPLTLWDNIERDYLKLLSDLTQLEFRDNKKRIITTLRQMLFQNIAQATNGERINHLGLEYFSINVYRAITFSNNLKLEKQEVFSFFDSFLINIFYEFIYVSLEEEWRFHIRLCEYLNLLKLLVDEGEVRVLENSFFEKTRMYTQKEPIALSVLIICAYLYYLGYCETSQHYCRQKEHSIKLINYLLSTRNNALRSIDMLELLKKHREFVFSILRRWELLFGNTPQRVIMGETLYDFIIFNLLSYGVDYAMDYVLLLNEYELQTLAYQYLSNKDAQEEEIKAFISFPFYKNQKKANVMKRFLERLKVYLKNREQQRIDQLDSQIIEKVQQKFLKKTEELIHRRVRDYLSSQPFSGINDHSYSIKRVLSQKISLSIIQEEKVQENIENIVNSFIDDIIYDAELLLKSKLIVRKTSIDNSDNHLKLLSMKQTNLINPDVFFGDRYTLWDLNEQQFNELFDNVKTIPSTAFMVALLDSKKIHWNIDGICLEYKSLSLKDFCCKELGNDMYEFTDSYGVKQEYRKEELEQYLNSTYRKIHLSWNFTLNVEDGGGVALDFTED